ncbi:uncharacterized protein LOC132341469 [Haemorhous mexicanus]|uniref:uncharacterized protein LOC132341469 n=1 Tax=Haemorhous mexicanus TaxID=30427 RepID=UPI0028BEF7C1|nr:uncharacterized protein LOC132341469 [Haemorhous mexicanus]
MSCSANFVSTTPSAVAISAGAVPETCPRGGTRGTSEKSSQIIGSTSDAGGKLGAASELQAAPISRRRGRAVMMQDPEVETRRFVRIAERMQAQAGQGLHAQTGSVDTASTEEERESETDTREETSEVERDRDSDVSVGETRSISEGAHARKVWTKRSRGQVRSPVTSRAKRGRAQSSTSRGSTPSPVPAPLISILVVQTSPIPERRSRIQPPLLAHSKFVQTWFQQSQILHSAETAEELIEFVMSSRSPKQMTAPPCGGMTAAQDISDLVSRATAPSRGQTATMHQFFPTTYKKKTTSKKTTQQMNYPSTSESYEFKDTSHEAQLQGENMIQITRSKRIPA